MPDGPEVVWAEDSVEIVADLDRRRLEALTVELRSLARRYRLDMRVRHAALDQGRRADPADPGPASAR